MLIKKEKLKKDWLLLPEIETNLFYKGKPLPRIISQLLYNRKIVEEKDINVFFSPVISRDLLDPFLFNQMESAVDLIIKHIKNLDLIIVYGDYDADGVTASSVLIEVLTLLKAKVDIYIPNRVKDGYGMNKKSIEEISKQNAKLIITVDNGVRNYDEIEYAKSLGIDVIITDHHVPPEDKIPNCIIINPKIEDEKYPFKLLAGVGVAFKVAQAIISKAKLEDVIKDEISLRVLDLVAIGTIADCVSLVGENRVLANLGLIILNDKRRVGIRELISFSKISDRISSWHIGWLLAPRINAAGRIKHANKAYELLSTKDVKTAKEIAQGLEVNNSERQKITDEIVRSIEDEIKKTDNKKIIIACCPGIENGKDYWNEGVIGLAASRICDKYYLPALVITTNGKEIKGSGRSIEEFHITKAIEQASSYLEKFGGHAAACGFSLKDKQSLPGFIQKINELAEKQLTNIKLKPKIKIESLIDLSEIDEELIENLEKFEPFGEGNAKPKFLTQYVTVIDIMNMGAEAQHIKIKLKSENSKMFNAIGFGQSQHWTNLNIGDKIDIVFYVEINRFNGRQEIQLKIIDIKTYD